jgi:hypothetical protein
MVLWLLVVSPKRLTLAACIVVVGTQVLLVGRKHTTKRKRVILEAGDAVGPLGR